MTVADAFIAVALGLVAGVYSGLLGVGGGIILVPGMVLLLGFDQHTAEGTSLLVIIPTAIAGATAAFRRGLVERETAPPLALGGIVGAVLGATLALHVIDDAETLTRIFGVFLVLIAIRMIVRPPKKRAAPGQEPDPLAETPEP